MDIRMVLCMAVASALAAAANGDWDSHFRRGEVSERAGQYAASAVEFEAALAEAERFPKTDWRLPVTLHNLGIVYRELGRYPDAQRSYRRAIEIVERWQPERKAESASSTFDLGTVCLLRGQLSCAESLYRSAYQLRLEMLGARHALVGASLHGLARVAQERRKFRDAEGYYRQATEVLEAAFGRDSREAADVAHNWGMLYRDEGRTDEARPLLARARAIYEQTAPAHPKLAVILRNLADLEASAGNLGKAADLFEQAIGICNRSLPVDHPQTGVILEAYARFLRQAGHKKEADLAKAQARAILASHSRPGSTGYTIDVSELPFVR